MEVLESSTFSSQTERLWPENWLKKSWVIQLHHKFSTLFLQKFTSSFPDEETKAEWLEMWGAGLAGMTGEQVKKGLEQCARTLSWAPTIAEFKGLCQLPPKAFPQLPPPDRVKSDVQKQCMDQIREMLGKGFKRPGIWWAEKIVTRHEMGDTVQPYALKLAQEAIANKTRFDSEPL